MRAAWRRATAETRITRSPIQKAKDKQTLKRQEACYAADALVSMIVANGRLDLARYLCRLQNKIELGMPESVALLVLWKRYEHSLQNKECAVSRLASPAHRFLRLLYVYVCVNHEPNEPVQGGDIAHVVDHYVKWPLYYRRLWDVAIACHPLFSVMLNHQDPDYQTAQAELEKAVQASMEQAVHVSPNGRLHPRSETTLRFAHASIYR